MSINEMSSQSTIGLIIEERKKNYDEFVKHYNRKKHKVSVLAEFSSISLCLKSNINSFEKAQTKHLKKFEKLVCDYLEEANDSHFVSDDEFELISKKMKYAQKSLEEYVEDSFASLYNPSILYKDIENVLIDYIDKYSFQDYDEVLTQILQIEREKQKAKERRKTINFLHRVIFEKSCPSSLKLYEDLSDQEKAEISETTKGKRGRNDNPDAPQDEIEELIKELIKKGRDKEPGYKKYWHHKGRYKGNPKYEQIINKIIEEDLDGGMTREGVKNRIRRYWYK